MNLRRNDIALRMWSSGSILVKGSITRSGNDGMAAALPEVLCAGRKLSAAAIAARCLGCDQAPTKRTPSRSSAQGSCSVRWAT